MSDEERNAGDSGAATAAASGPREQPFPDEHTTVPDAPATGPASSRATTAGKWEMPKPKFQQTSGYLPQGYLKDLKDAARATSTPGGETAQEQGPFAAAAPAPATDGGGRPPAALEIEPQPDLADQLIPEEPALYAPPASTTAPKGGSGAVAVILGIIGILIFISLFAAAVYYFFIAGRASGSTF